MSVHVGFETEEGDVRVAVRSPRGRTSLSSEYAVVTGSKAGSSKMWFLRVLKGIRSSSHATISCRCLKIWWLCDVQAG